MKPIAAVECHCGRMCLMIAGIVVAMEGDPCRDVAYHKSYWTTEALADAAKRINEC